MSTLCRHSRGFTGLHTGDLTTLRNLWRGTSAMLPAFIPFSAVATACERQETTKIRIGGLSWATDARLSPKRPHRIFVKFMARSAVEYRIEPQRALSACEEFSRSDGAGADG